MQVNRQELLSQLSKVKPGLSSKDRVEQASSFVFDGGNLVAYNESVMVIAPQPIEDLQGAVRAEELLGILNKLKSENVDVSVADGQMIIKSGRSKSGIRFEEEVRVPVDNVLADFETVDQIKIPAGLLPAMQQAKFCASRSLQDSRLTGIHVKGGKVTSTDNYRIIQVAVKGAKKLPEFLLPATCVDYLLPYNPVSMAITDTWAFFLNDDGLLFCVRLIQQTEDEPYPDMTDHLAVEGPELVLPVGILEGIDKADVFTRSADHESDKFVEVTLKKGRVIVRGAGAFGWHEESIQAKDYDGEELAFAAHPEFLKGILPQVQSAVLGENTMRFDGDGFVHVFALSALDATDEEE